MTSLEPATASHGGGGLPSWTSPPAQAHVPQDESEPTQQEHTARSDELNRIEESNNTTSVDNIPPRQSSSAPEPNDIDSNQQQRQGALDNLMAALQQNQQPMAADASQDAGYWGAQPTNAPPELSSDKRDAASANELSPSLLSNVAPGPNVTSGPTLDEMPSSTAGELDTDELNFALENAFSLAEMEAATQQKRKIGAYAKLTFDDGHYYMCTHSMELGRDVIAYQDAQMREREGQDGLQLRARNSSSRMSRPSDRMKRGLDSQMPGSVVSESGGFAGLDNIPTAEGSSGHGKGHPSNSSQVSDAVDPCHLDLSRTFDYDKRAEEIAAIDPDDGERAAPVTAAHLPNPDMCPLIPIHATTDSDEPETAIHKRISRRHVRIEWSGEDECFVLTVLATNGAFLDDVFYRKGERKLKLKDGSRIQISGIEIRFDLPPPEESVSPSLPEFEGSPERPSTITPISTPDRSTTPARVNGRATNKKASPRTMPASATAAPLVGPDGQPIQRKRGPGRPPKDGIMSTRERKELEKKAKAEQAKAANGGTTPPPAARPRGARPPTDEELARATASRQAQSNISTSANVKRRRSEDGDVMQSIEDGEEDDIERRATKKSRQSKSPSPNYPPMESLTEEQLARPADPYARLIYDLLMEIYPRALPLKQIYRAIKTKFPFFVYKVESNGWESSVRHNLNQEFDKLFHKGEKEGKGYAWRAIPGALPAQGERKKAAATGTAAKPKPQQPRQQNPPNPYMAPNGYGSPAGGQYPPGQGPPNQGRPYQSTGHNASGTTVRAAPPTKVPFPPKKNNPTSARGVYEIIRFESGMRERAEKKSGATVARFMLVFNSAKARVVHGAPASLIPGPENNDEKWIVERLKVIVKDYANPEFERFDYKPPPAPVVKPAAPPARPQSSAQAGPSQGQIANMYSQPSGSAARPPQGPIAPQQVQGPNRPPPQIQNLGGPYPRPSELRGQNKRQSPFPQQQQTPGITATSGSGPQVAVPRPGSALGPSRPGPPGNPVTNATPPGQANSPYQHTPPRPASAYSISRQGTPGTAGATALPPGQGNGLYQHVPRSNGQGSPLQQVARPASGQNPPQPYRTPQQSPLTQPNSPQLMPPQQARPAQASTAINSQQPVAPVQNAPQPVSPRIGHSQQVSAPNTQQQPSTQRLPQQVNTPVATGGSENAPTPPGAPIASTTPAPRQTPYPTVGQSMQAAAAASTQNGRPQHQAVPNYGASTTSAAASSVPTAGFALHLSDTNHADVQGHLMDDSGDTTMNTTAPALKATTA
ncbi:uncharacterized protein AB675_3837 [Cyphellophora attinorum]|uniref:Fork-head transcriptional regulator 2 n=1 Tax=Cyphellophora attinorum TaxID=1664694 RepID=A0A0N1HH19_9EURO|nr:uncharacterized protein AB675_3837 [Phialophora attinorum]KPI34914.1 hypothetical protein AB675_3837 [Phialophora attinorum]